MLSARHRLPRSVVLRRAVSLQIFSPSRLFACFATYEALRTIRVILSEAIYRQIITSCNGYVAVAALTGVMNVTFGCSISLEEVLGILCKFGSQYVEVISPEGLWLVKNKSPSTVPNWFTFRPQSQVPIVHPPGASARVPRQS